PDLEAAWADWQVVLGLQEHVGHVPRRLQAEVAFSNEVAEQAQARNGLDPELARYSSGSAVVEDSDATVHLRKGERLALANVLAIIGPHQAAGEASESCGLRDRGDRAHIEPGRIQDDVQVR